MAFSSRSTITAISRILVFASNSNANSSPFFFASSFFRRCLQRRFCTLPLPPLSAAFSTNTFPSSYPSSKVGNFDAIKRLFSSEPNTTKKSVDTKVNFSLSDSDSEDDARPTQNTQKESDKNEKLPPPYDPFNKKPAIEEPKDPKDLQEIFHNMRTGDGLFNHAVKMFDALSKDGLTHEALELFGQIKDKGHMPDVVAHTAIIEAYANAGQPKEALKVYMRMLASGVSPNAYTYTVLIKGLAANAKFLRDAKRCVLEMMDKGVRPNAATYTSVFEALAREEKLDEATELLEQLKAKGFVPDEKAVREVLSNKRGPVREVLSNKRGPVFRTVINVLFGK